MDRSHRRYYSFNILFHYFIFISVILSPLYFFGFYRNTFFPLTLRSEGNCFVCFSIFLYFVICMILANVYEVLDVQIMSFRFFLSQKLSLYHSICATIIEAGVGVKLSLYIYVRQTILSYGRFFSNTVQNHCFTLFVYIGLP